MFGKFNKTEEYSPCAADCQPCHDEGTLGSPARSAAGCEGLGMAEGPAACVNANGWPALENQIISIYACLMRISKAYNVANASRLRAGALSRG